MASSDERVRVNCTVSEADWTTIQELAKRMEVSPTRMASLLLRAGLQDNETVIRIVSSDVVKRGTEGLKAISGGSTKRAKSR